MSNNLKGNGFYNNEPQRQRRRQGIEQRVITTAAFLTASEREPLLGRRNPPLSLSHTKPVLAVKVALTSAVPCQLACCAQAALYLRGGSVRSAALESKGAADAAHRAGDLANALQSYRAAVGAECYTHTHSGRKDRSAAAPSAALPA